MVIAAHGYPLHCQGHTYQKQSDNDCCHPPGCVVTSPGCLDHQITTNYPTIRLRLGLDRVLASSQAGTDPGPAHERPTLKAFLACAELPTGKAQSSGSSLQIKLDATNEARN